MPHLLSVQWSLSNSSQVETQTKEPNEKPMSNSRLKTMFLAHALRPFISRFPFIHPTWFLSTPEHLTWLIFLRSLENRLLILALDVTFSVPWSLNFHLYLFSNRELALNYFHLEISLANYNSQWSILTLNFDYLFIYNL